MKLLLTLVTISYLLLTEACTTCSTKKITCPAFNEPLFFEWFPYQVNQYVYYKNLSSGDTVGYFVYHKYQSEQQEITTGGYGGGSRYCPAEASINGSNNDFFKGSISIYYWVPNDLNGNNTSKTLEILFYNSQWKANAILNKTIEAPEASAGISITTQNNIQFANGITYANMVTFTQDTLGTKEDKVYKLYIAKNAGIVGFEMYPSKQKWVIQ